MKQKYHVNLNNSERNYIQEIIDSTKTSRTIRKRASILLLLDESVSKPEVQEKIAKRCNVCNVTVHHTIKNYCENGIEKTLSFKTAKEPQKKPVIQGETEARLIAIACSEPPKGFSKWSLKMIASKMIELEIVDSVCPETVRKALKKQNLNLT